MRWFRGVLIFTATASLILGLCCGLDSRRSARTQDPVRPPDPNSAMYGVWDGELVMNQPYSTTHDPITIEINSRGVLFWWVFHQYPVENYTLADPKITLEITVSPGNRVTLNGTRSDQVLRGEASAPVAEATGTWAVAKR